MNHKKHDNPAVAMTPQQFQHAILSWFDSHGRKHLPWQQNKTPYKVWISEIMLQQTQVNTVIPYFERFMQHFPELMALANAKEDEVLHLWAGLGYYSRARNLHKAAKMVAEKYQGEFPSTVEGLCELPGIGRSTAGAILALASNLPAPILDGNVKRVLARFHALDAPVNEKKIENQLWELATLYTPQDRVADYTQAMMDLGATLCTRGKPACLICPLMATCSARQQGIADLLPVKKTTKELPVRTATFLVIKKDQKILLHKRPSVGIWGGLWSLPEITGLPEQKTIQDYCRQQLKITFKDYSILPMFRHTFSHYHLDISPVVIELKKAPAKVMEGDSQIWYNPSEPHSVGLPKPIQSIMRAFL